MPANLDFYDDSDPWADSDEMVQNSTSKTYPSEEDNWPGSDDLVVWDDATRSYVKWLKTQQIGVPVEAPKTDETPDDGLHGLSTTETTKCPYLANLAQNTTKTDKPRKAVAMDDFPYIRYEASQS